jgi:hypothetical protein
MSDDGGPAFPTPAVGGVMGKLRNKFIAAVKRQMPEAFFGLVPNDVVWYNNKEEYVLIAVYFLRAFDQGGKPLDLPLTNLSADWKQVTLHIWATNKAILLNAADLDALARERILSAQDAIPPNDPFFAKIAA